MNAFVYLIGRLYDDATISKNSSQSTSISRETRPNLVQRYIEKTSINSENQSRFCSSLYVYVYSSLQILFTTEFYTFEIGKSKTIVSRCNVIVISLEKSHKIQLRWGVLHLKYKILLTN